MKRLVAAGLLVGLTWLAIDLVGDATQTRPERTRPGSRSRITLEVSVREDRKPMVAAEALWGACQWLVRRRLEEPGMVQIRPNRFTFVVVPELGSGAQRRLEGCLEDATIDRVLGRVVEVRSWTDGAGAG